MINIRITIDDAAAAGSVGDEAGVSFVIFPMSVLSILMCDASLCIELILSINLVPLS